MKVLFDTSALVTAVVSQLPHHAAALTCYRRHRKSGRVRSGLCTTHALAESYATLTALPLSPRIAPADAVRLVAENFLAHLDVVALEASDHKSALERVALLGLASGVVYDALHLACAERLGCDRLYTYNIGDFTRLVPRGTKVVVPGA
jgi:predicted nucleic acid-binding protein